jgi:hypothetical protein
VAIDYELILPQVKAVLEAIPDIGLVFDFDRRVDKIADWDPYRVVIGGVSQIRGWDITSLGDEWEAGPVGAHEHFVTFLVMGYQGARADGTSEKSFRALAELVCQELRRSTTLNGTVREVLPPRIAKFQPRAIYPPERLHYVEIEFEVVLDHSLVLAW